jgi:hypothetical protein
MYDQVLVGVSPLVCYCQRMHVHNSEVVSTYRLCSLQGAPLGAKRTSPPPQPISLTRHRYPPPCGCAACCVLLRLAFACSFFLLLQCNGGLWTSFSFLGASIFFFLCLQFFFHSAPCITLESAVLFFESQSTPKATYQTVRGGFTLMLCRLYADRGYGPYPPSRRSHFRGGRATTPPASF